MQNKKQKVNSPSILARVLRELGIWCIILTLLAFGIGGPFLYAAQNPGVFVTYPRGSSETAIPAVPVALPATPAANETPNPSKFLIATRTNSPGWGARGIVIAPEAVEIRDYPEGAGLESRNVGYLYPRESIAEIDCQYVTDSVWVLHALGWSIVRNASSEFISGVCLP